MNAFILGLMKVHVQFVLWEKLLRVAELSCYFCLNVHFSNEHSRRLIKLRRKKGKSQIRKMPFKEFLENLNIFKSADR